MSGKRSHPTFICQCEVCGVDFHPPLSSVVVGKVRPGTGRFCSLKCSGVGRRGARLTLEERFWRYVDKNGPIPTDFPLLGPCWNWTGSTNGTKWQYGYLGKTAANEVIMAHRFSYELHTRPIPDGMLLRHLCHRPVCVNPAHLVPGDPTSNAADMMEAGRHPFCGDDYRGPEPIVPHKKVTREDRFWVKIDKNGPAIIGRPELGPCWLWTGCKDAGGYGKIGTGGGKGTIPAHKFSWMLANGPIADDLLVLHVCDVRACCSPQHLFLGTDADNMRDKVAKNRDVPNRSLTDEQVQDARLRISRGETQRSVAELLGVSQATISYAVRRLRYKRTI